MKFSALTIATALGAVIGGSAIAQTMSPPVTMQPIPNPPEKAAAHPHKAKHHAKMATPAPAASDSTAPSAK